MSTEHSVCIINPIRSKQMQSGRVLVHRYPPWRCVAGCPSDQNSYRTAGAPFVRPYHEIVCISSELIPKGILNCYPDSNSMVGRHRSTEQGQQSIYSCSSSGSHWPAFLVFSPIPMRGQLGRSSSAYFEGRMQLGKREQHYSIIYYNIKESPCFIPEHQHSPLRKCIQSKCECPFNC